MIKNFSKDDLIYKGTNCTIIHGKGGNPDEPICVKVLNQEFPTSDQSWYVENEYEFSFEATCPAIRKALRQTLVENHKGIVFEYIEGFTLQDFVRSKYRSYHELLSTALELALAISDLHKANIIHNNINPANILVQQGTSRVYLIDLQIASRSTIKLEDTNNHIIRKATIAYVAPEQTGRINRVIDYRTDLYSLGVVLYEMFTGKLPFVSDDPIELVYSHLAKTPMPPDQLRKDLSPIVSAIIMKLLSKNAEDRYQSAMGVYYDLKHCLIHNFEKEDHFELGASDFSGKLYIHPTLYGKDSERKKLIEVFGHSATGACELILVYGYSGSGKTSLVNELQRPVTDHKGFFVRGKFEQFQQDTPYSAFILAFKELINYLLTKDTHEVARWKNIILDKVGTLGKVLTDLIPGMEALIGKQPEIPHLRGSELQNRFNYVLGNFIKAIASKNNPLVIFIDDLQWADGSSINLFNLILTDRESKFITLIGAYRDNEVTSDHPLAKMQEGLHEKNIIFHEIEVTNLSEFDVERLVDELLSTGQPDSQELSSLIYQKTNGNPFFIQRFLQSISDAGNMYFDFERKIWKWKVDEIKQMNVSGNVADLMKSAIEKLPARTVDVLKMAACIGIRFDLDKLSLSTDLGENILQSILQQPLADGLIISAASHYKFAHDRIQQTIFSLLPEAEQKEYHLKIGRALSAFIGDKDLDEQIFDVVNHWNIGADIIKDRETRHYVAQLNLQAGRRARASAAYQQAFQYFEKGLLLLDKDAWNNNYEFTLQLNHEASEIAFQCGEMERAEEIVTSILKNARDARDTIKAQEVKIQKLIAGNRQTAAIELGLEILKKLGIRFPAKPGKLSIITGLIRTKMRLGNKPPDFFEHLPLCSDPEKLAAHRILTELLSAGYFAAPDLVPLLIFKLVELSVKDGLSPKSPFAFAALGYILSAYTGNVDEGIRYGDISIYLTNKLKTDESNPRVQMTYNVFLVHWKKKLSLINDDLEKAFKSGLETGDNEYSSYLAQNITYNSLYSGVQLHTLAEKSEQLDRQIEKFKQDLTIIRLRVFRQCIENLIYDATEPDVFAGTIFDETQTSIEDSPQNYLYFQNLNLQKTFMSIVFNKDNHAYTYAKNCERYLESIKGSVLELVFYFYQSLALTGIYSSLSPHEKSQALKKLKANIKRLRQYERLCRENYQQKRQLVEAEYHRVLGNREKARNLYDEAIRTAVENHMIQDEAMCWERTGLFYKGQHHDLLAEFYFRNALHAYQRWGATAKVRQMAVQYEEIKNVSMQAILETLPRDAPDQSHMDIDMATIIKASTALSGEIVLSNLLKKLMQILLENAGAQQGFLILEKNSERVIEAEVIAETGEVSTLKSIPLHTSDAIAKSIVNYVTLKRETVLLDNAVQSTLFGDDEYIKKHKSKSILCTPLINQGKLQGVIYLANDLMAGAFTEKRLDFIRLLSGQIAISIENALFYDKLEQRVEERTLELQEEKKKSDNLLLNILPKEVAEELKNTGRSKARRYEQVTVMFTDFKDFTRHSENMTPEQLVGEVDFCFRKFDQIISKHHLEKIKTIGDAYLCVGGIPDDAEGAVRIVRAALEMRDFISHTHKERSFKEGSFFQMRIGITTGPVVAGIVGEKKFAYDIWGDTVNTAARMEQTGEVGKINISGVTYELVKDKFDCTYRGKISAKNKGEIDMYFVA